MDMKDKKLTVIGTVDAVEMVNKLRKSWHTEVIAVGPAKEPEKKKEEPKKEGKKKELMGYYYSAKEPEKKKEKLKKEGEKKELMDSYPFSSSASSSSNSRLMHKVFINFSPKDDSKVFVSHLHGALAKAKIEPYTDYKLHKGTAELGPELLEAIEYADVSIIVFSQNYTESSSCLNELEKIMEIHRTHGNVVMPVFCGVDPSEVRHQQGAFGKNLHATAKKIYLDKELRENTLFSWKNALKQAAILSGWVSIDSR
jgi:hypothetical protein